MCYHVDDGLLVKCVFKYLNLHIFPGVATAPFTTSRPLRPMIVTQWPARYCPPEVHLGTATTAHIIWPLYQLFHYLKRQLRLWWPCATGLHLVIAVNTRAPP